MTDDLKSAVARLREGIAAVCDGCGEELYANDDVRVRASYRAGGHDHHAAFIRFTGDVDRAAVCDAYEEADALADRRKAALTRLLALLDSDAVHGALLFAAVHNWRVSDKQKKFAVDVRAEVAAALSEGL